MPDTFAVGALTMLGIGLWAWCLFLIIEEAAEKARRARNESEHD